MKRILAVTLILLFAVCLPSCQPTDEDAAAVNALTETFFSAWRAADYDGMYACLSRSTKQNFTKEEFASVYADTAAALGFQLVTILPGSTTRVSEAQYACSFSVSYLTQNAGLLDYDMTADVYFSSRGWELEWNPGLVLPGLQKGDTIRYVILKAKRGEIFDSEGRLLAANGYADTVVLNLLTCQDTGAAAAALAPLLGVEEKTLLDKIDKAVERNEQVALLADYLPGTLSETLRDSLTAFDDVYVDSSLFTPIRYYPYGQYASHLIGYVGAITAEELKTETYAGYKGTELVGKTGLEASYERILHGVDGERLAVYSAAGKRRFDLRCIPAVDGRDVKLTIDISYQASVEQTILKYIHENQTAAAVALDPTTGKLLAAASYPSYNNNAFSSGISKSEWAYYQDEKNLYPLLNRVTRGQYAPGSTMKPFVASWALDAGVLTTSDVFPYSITYDGYWNPVSMYPKWAYHRIKRHTSGSGPLNMFRGLVHSDNIYFAWAALKLGGEAFTERAVQLGFTTAIDFETAVLPPQISGARDVRTDLGLLADSGYGQGEMLVTPLQMACFYGALANNGTIMTPYVVESVNTDENGALSPVSVTEPTVWRADVLSASSLSQVLPLMVEVVNQGTGYNARISGVSVAGKTGTAQVGDREHTWMICFVNDDTADLLVCVMVDSPADATSDRVLMARSIMKIYLDSIKEESAS